MCPSCLQQVPTDISDCEVKVWWAGDETFYEGRVEVFDKVSGKHRVRYQDTEWEFLRLSDEGYLMNLTPERLDRLVKVVHGASSKTPATSLVAVNASS